MPHDERVIQNNIYIIFNLKNHLRIKKILR